MDLVEQRFVIHQYQHAPKFTGRHVPLDEIAKATRKSSAYLREGLKQGIFNFGYTMKSKSGKQYSFYCPDKLVWEQTGYFNENPNEFKGL